MPFISNLVLEYILRTVLLKFGFEILRLYFMRYFSNNHNIVGNSPGLITRLTHLLFTYNETDGVQY